MRRIWRLRPSMIVTSYQGLSPSLKSVILAGAVRTFSGERLSADLWLDRLQDDAFAQAVQRVFRRNTGNFYQVHFLHVRGSMRELLRQITVIGKQQQTFAGVVETSYGIDANANVTNQVHHRRTAFGIAGGCHVPLGLVEHDVNVAIRRLDAACC